MKNVLTLCPLFPFSVASHEEYFTTLTFIFQWLQIGRESSTQTKITRCVVSPATVLVVWDCIAILLQSQSYGTVLPVNTKLLGGGEGMLLEFCFVCSHVHTTFIS